MLVTEFLEQVENPPLSADAAPGRYMRLFLHILEEYAEERTSVLLGKIRAHMSEALKKDVELSGEKDVCWQNYQKRKMAEEERESACEQ